MSESRVVVTNTPDGRDGVVVKTQLEAEQDAASRNERAEQLGIKTRYEVASL